MIWLKINICLLAYIPASASRLSREWAKEEMTAYLDRNTEEDKRIEAQVAREGDKPGRKGGGRGRGF